jgi:drug/metabolite transporter (DMT)-like permease
MAQARLTLGQYSILGLVAICAPLGDTVLDRGMSHMPAISLTHPEQLLAAVFTPWIVAGIALLICFFACYLTALSWADLTYVSAGNRLRQRDCGAAGASFWLHEPITLYRWAGIIAHHDWCRIRGAGAITYRASVRRVA